ncbi:MAG: helix-turn-helix transcriptional regulator [Pyrobaculum sp.]
MLDTIKVEILKKVATQGYTTVSEVVKELNLTWGAAQWHLFWLENNGYIKSVNINGTTIYVLNCANVLRKLEALTPTEPKPSGRRRASSASTRQ